MKSIEMKEPLAMLVVQKAMIAVPRKNQVRIPLSYMQQGQFAANFYRRTAETHRRAELSLAALLLHRFDWTLKVM